MKFIAENGKIIVDNSMTKAEAEERLVKMKSRQTNLTAKIAGMDVGDAKTTVEARRVALDARVTNLEAEIAKI